MQPNRYPDSRRRTGQNGPFISDNYFGRTLGKPWPFGICEKYFGNPYRAGLQGSGVSRPVAAGQGPAIYTFDSACARPCRGSESAPRRGVPRGESRVGRAENPGFLRVIRLGRFPVEERRAASGPGQASCSPARARPFCAGRRRGGTLAEAGPGVRRGAVCLQESRAAVGRAGAPRRGLKSRL